MADNCVRCGHKLKFHWGWELAFYGSLLGLIPAFLTEKWLFPVLAITAVTAKHHTDHGRESWCPRCKANGLR